MDHVTDRVEFQKKVLGDSGKIDNSIDAYIPETRVLIEQKSLNIDLSKPQSGHNGMTPYEQAKMYDNALPVSEKAKWIVLSNFAEIWVYDMDTQVPEPTKFSLAEIQTKYSSFEFLFNKKQTKLNQEMEISVKAGEFVGLIYEALLRRYIDPTKEESLKSFNMLCVRLVFCLYAEDAHIFGDSGHMFHDYMEQFETKDMRKALIELFKILDTPEADRDPYDTSDLSKFPYVNGGLFAEEDIEIPNFTNEIRDILLSRASDGFDWSMISPTIFGAVFESTLNPETRRVGGMHYTSIENIHKVIDPLFLDDLKAEYAEIESIGVVKNKKAKAEAFQKKLASLTWLDPACGSGNFLTETYISIRRLENQVIRTILDCDNKQVDGQIVLGLAINPIKVGINQFYGIEINDFAVTVAKTALWIAESQTMKETEDIIHMSLDFLPLKTNACIIEKNALRIDWSDVVAPSSLSYIMGNPPFIGARQMDKDKTIPKEKLHQKADMNIVFGKLKGLGNLDYVSAWYKKCADYIENYPIKCAFVSTNSITQGEQPGILWKLLSKEGVKINFAHRTFQWDSEAHIKAHVHCVIIGFSKHNEKIKRLFDGDSCREVDNINAYLLNAPDIFIEKVSKSIVNAPNIIYGSFALDDGNFTIDKEEYENIKTNDPDALQFLKPFIGAYELLHNQERYCVWLKGVSPALYGTNKTIMAKVNNVRVWRSKSDRKETLLLAETPAIFAEIRQPDRNYLAIPTVSSERRAYLPVQYMTSDIIASNQLYVIPDATLYEFGVLMSNVHNAWIRAIAGRLKSDIRYSSKIVYNNFPWPNPTDEMRANIINAAQEILDVRAKYPDCSLEVLYDKNKTPEDLVKAHNKNNVAVMKAYGFSVRDMSEADCVEALMKMYLEIVQ